MAKRVVILGYASSVHIIRWANAIAADGFDVHLVSLGGEPVPGIDTTIFAPGKFRRLSYITNLVRVKRLIKNLKPDILHSHYATGYGLWGAFSGFHPHIITVWGSDILSFPSNFFRRIILRKILISSDRLTAAGRFLSQATEELIPEWKGKILNIPFGVVIPNAINRRPADETVRLIFMKAHERIYGPDILLHALKIACASISRIHLTMAGEGSQTSELRVLMEKLGLQKVVSFPGAISHDQVYSILAEHDIMVMPSRQESFGVAALEASAAGLPVIASKIEGIPEVVIDGETGILVPPENPELLAGAITRLAENAAMREKLGSAGRKFVAENYRWDDNIKQMTELYKSMIKN